MANVLLLEDDQEIAEPLCLALAKSGYVVDHVTTLADADAALSVGAFDVLILDRSVPGGDSLGLLQRIRRAGDTTAAIVLTARDTVPDRVAGLSAGADDYLVKPFALEELLARLRALLRRPAHLEPRTLTCGAVSFDLETRAAAVAGAPMQLRRQEAALLEALLRAAGRVVPRDRLEHALNRLEDARTPNALEQTVSRLRRTLSDHSAGITIEAIRGVGYVLRQGAP